jgi:hypothetical protein
MRAIHAATCPTTFTNTPSDSADADTNNKNARKNPFLSTLTGVEDLTLFLETIPVASGGVTVT